MAEKAATAARGRATRSDSIHLTLAFIGDVDADRLPALIALGDAVVEEPFLLTLDTIGVFRRAEVAWIAPTVCPEALLTLQKTLANALARSGFRIESRPFAPHVTLARHSVRAFDQARVDPPVEWPVAAFALWASTIAPVGAHYDELARWRLACTGSRG